jgi:hypothetical protein
LADTVQRGMTIQFIHRFFAHTARPDEQPGMLASYTIYVRQRADRTPR